MMYAIETASSAVIYIPRFMKIGSTIQKLMLGGGGDIHRHADSMAIS
jgi:hypothetical protein